MLELLAPAGDMSALTTAINSGADAVYLGLDNFNARMRADNFTTDNIAEVVSYAHFYGVKVYVTINTILQNNEFNELILLVKRAVLANVDAFLVQDLGVAKVLKEHFDGIVLHASTQMGVHNLYGAQVAEKMGFKRVVLSRETKLEDIKEIARNTSLEIEYFVQGALCIAFSGNCYLSSIEQGTSGNRGLCKQLCRLPYAAKTKAKSQRAYMLSARDLCLANSVKQLADAGVTSFKIEGRLRRDGYVAEAVREYRAVIDSIERGEQKVLSQVEKDNLKIAFSRGEFLQRAYLDDGTPDIVEKRYNNHTGIRIGSVKDVKPFRGELFEIIISSNRPLSKGDGIKFFDGEKEVASLGVGEAREVGKNTYSVISTAKVKSGLSVNLICDAQREKQLLQAKRSVKINVQVSALCGEPLCIKAIYSDGNEFVEATAVADTPLEKAQNAPTSRDEIKKQCSKTADSGFCVQSVSVKTDGVFVAKSVLNALRREVLDTLKTKIINARACACATINKDAQSCVEDIINGCEEQQERVLKIVDGDKRGSTMIKKGDKAVIRPNRWTESEIRQTLALLGADEEDVALDLPIIANGKDIEIIEKTLSELPKIRTLVSENIYGLHFVQKGYNVIVGQGHNIANVFAAECAKDLGAGGYVPSLEYRGFLAKKDILRYCVSEDIPLMTFAHCPYKTLYGNDCGKCSFKDDMILQREKHTYRIRRNKLSQCYFALYPEK